MKPLGGMDHVGRANERQPSIGKPCKSLLMLPTSGSDRFPGEVAGTPSTESFKNKQA